jgi:hypothetical protein
MLAPQATVTQLMAPQVVPAGQAAPEKQLLGPHAPSVQLSPVGQICPQPPQLLGSLWRSTQPPPQQAPAVVLSPQTVPLGLVAQSGLGAQEPPLQNRPASQPLPQKPQLAGSLRVLEQLLPQQVPAAPPAAQGP